MKKQTKKSLSWATLLLPVAVLLILLTTGTLPTKCSGPEAENLSETATETATESSSEASGLPAPTETNKNAMNMKIPKVPSATSFFDDLDRDPGAFDYHTVGNVNWPDEFPAHPDVRFVIAHTGGSVLIKFYVSEDYTLAAVAEDNGPVWTDSCVEFFIAFDDTGYYNLETTCIGKALLGWRQSRDVFTHADDATLASIRRSSSLGTEPFAERQGQSWEMDIEIPASAFFGHTITDLSGKRARGNFYKCGDNMTAPQFLSWSPIDNPTPNFHLTEFFGGLEFE
ncbi:MAG: hypothetical protein LBU97_02345 [Alistipes sp.]|jgi:hypothetical protein|nr:hypothetical protein [Alistipes sp.]